MTADAAVPALANAAPRMNLPHVRPADAQPEKAQKNAPLSGFHPFSRTGRGFMLTCEKRHRDPGEVGSCGGSTTARTADLGLERTGGSHEGMDRLRGQLPQVLLRRDARLRRRLPTLPA